MPTNPLPVYAPSPIYPSSVHRTLSLPVELLTYVRTTSVPVPVPVSSSVSVSGTATDRHSVDDLPLRHRLDPEPPRTGSPSVVVESHSDTISPPSPSPCTETIVVQQRRQAHKRSRSTSTIRTTSLPPYPAIPLPLMPRPCSDGSQCDRLEVSHAGNDATLLGRLQVGDGRSSGKVGGGADGADSMGGVGQGPATSGKVQDGAAGEENAVGGNGGAGDVSNVTAVSSCHDRSTQHDKKDHENLESGGRDRQCEQGEGYGPATERAESSQRGRVDAVDDILSSQVMMESSQDRSIDTTATVNARAGISIEQSQDQHGARQDHQDQLDSTSTSFGAVTTPQELDNEQECSPSATTVIINSVNSSSSESRGIFNAIAVGKHPEEHSARESYLTQSTIPSAVITLDQRRQSSIVRRLVRSRSLASMSRRGTVEKGEVSMGSEMDVLQEMGGNRRERARSFAEGGAGGGDGARRSDRRNLWPAVTTQLEGISRHSAYEQGYPPDGAVVRATTDVDKICESNDAVDDGRGTQPVADEQWVEARDLVTGEARKTQQSTGSNSPSSYASLDPPPPISDTAAEENEHSSSATVSKAIAPSDAAGPCHPMFAVADEQVGRQARSMTDSRGASFLENSEEQEVEGAAFENNCSINQDRAKEALEDDLGAIVPAVSVQSLDSDGLPTNPSQDDSRHASQESYTPPSQSHQRDSARIKPLVKVPKVTDHLPPTIQTINDNGVSRNRRSRSVSLGASQASRSSRPSPRYHPYGSFSPLTVDGAPTQRNRARRARSVSVGSIQAFDLEPFDRTSDKRVGSADPASGSDQWDESRSIVVNTLVDPSSATVTLSSIVISPVANGSLVEDSLFEDAVKQGTQLVSHETDSTIRDASALVREGTPDGRVAKNTSEEQVEHVMSATPNSGQTTASSQGPPTSPIEKKRKRGHHELTAERAAEATKKLRLPFRPPMHRNNLHKYLGLVKPSQTKPSRSSPGPSEKDENKPFPRFVSTKPPTLRARNIASTRSSKPFKSPFPSSDPKENPSVTLAPSSSPTDPYALPISNVNRSAEISALERRLQILKQAQRLMKHSAGDDRLVELIDQWREAGRTVVEKIFAIMPEPAATNQQEDTTQQQHEDGSGCEEESTNQPWDHGRMMRTLQVDPDLLGWAGDVGDWTVV